MTEPARALIADAGHIADCVGAAYAHYVPRMGKPPGPMLADYADVVSRHQVWLVRGADAGVDGVLVLIPQDGHLLLDNIAVHPRRQGSGLGRQLLGLADTEARRQGFAELRLYTHVSMTENVALYRKLGWQVTGQGVQDGYERAFMRKPLAAGG